MMNDFPRVPDTLIGLFGHLQEDTDQDFIETPVDSGQPRRRPSGTPYTVLKGVFTELSTVQADALSNLQGVGAFCVERPNGETWLMAVKSMTLPRRTFTFPATGENTSSADVEIVLKRIRIMPKG